METFLSEMVRRKSDTGHTSWPESPDGVLLWLDMLQEILSKKHIMRETSIRLESNRQNNFATTLDLDSVIHIEQDHTDQDITDLLLTNAKRNRTSRFPPCDWKEKHCVENHLMKQCPIFIALSENERIAHLKQIGHCFNWFATLTEKI